MFAKLVQCMFPFIVRIFFVSGEWEDVTCEMRKKKEI
jgi:hypothetical protein